MASSFEHLAEVVSDEAGASGDEDGGHEFWELDIGNWEFDVVGFQYPIPNTQYPNFA